MEFRDRDGNVISDLNDWETLGKPAAANHWVPGRSAYELAADWCDGNAAVRATALVAEQFPGVHLSVGTAEQQTAFDGFRGGVRNHDLLVKAVCDSGPIVIGVEGKADEPFDQSVAKKKVSAVATLKENNRSKGFERLDALTRLFLNTPLEEIDAGDELGNVGYQLLTALAGTLADAKSEKAVGAVLMVHEFVTDKTTDEKHVENAEQYRNFLRHMGAVAPAGDGSDSGWITQPVEVTGDGTYMPKTLPVSFAKMVTTTRE